MIRKRLVPSMLLAAALLPAAASAQSPAIVPIPAIPPAPVAPAAPAASGTSYVPSAKVSRLADKPQGWSYNVKLGANINVAGNRDVVGQVNGRSLLFGASVLSGLGYLKGPHEWLNNGNLTETWSKTPAVDRFVKSADLLDLQSVYNYFLNEFTGPFARVAAQTSLFKTNRVTTSRVGYDNAATDVDESADPANQRTVFKLSDSFQPFTLTESLGWFLQPLHSERISAFGRAGLGGRHTWADGARAVSGLPTDATVKYTNLKDVHQGGAELFAGVDGKEMDGKVIYNVGLSSLFPIVNNDNGDPVTGKDRSILKLTKVALTAQAGVGIFTWMSLNYQLKVIRDVQLVDAIQVQNALLLSFQYTVSSPIIAPPPAPLPPEVVARIEDLQQRATAAELRAASAEARAAGVAADPALAPANPTNVPSVPVAPEPAPAPVVPPAAPAR